MACKTTALVASGLLIVSLVFMSFDTGVEAWCIQIPSPDIDACRNGGGIKNCRSKCRGYDGAQCDANHFSDCYCLKCAEQPPAAHSIAAKS